MKELSKVMFIIDPSHEGIALQEAKRLGIKVAALVDTNCDPDPIDYIIPGNDDAIKSIKLFSSYIADAILEGRAMYEEKLRADEDNVEEEMQAAAQGETAATSGDESSVVVEKIKTRKE